MRNFLYKGERGFTLFELLVYMACLLILIWGVSTLVLHAVQFRERLYAHDHVISLWSACTHIARDIRLCNDLKTIRLHSSSDVSWQFFNEKIKTCESVRWVLDHAVLKRITRGKVSSCVARSIELFSCQPVYKSGVLCGFNFVLKSARTKQSIERFVGLDNHALCFYKK